MGKYIHHFQTQEEYDNAIENNYVEPWVSYTEEGERVDYNKKDYFTIEASEDGTTVYFRQSPSAVDDNMPALKVQVSIDGGETWTEKTASAAEDEVPGTVIAELDEGDKVLIKGNNESYGYMSESEGDVVDYCNFWADKTCYVYGNIMSLVGGDNYATIHSVSEYAFAFFFADYGRLLEPWVLLKDGKELILPATTLADYCYSHMFDGCTGLTAAPGLPATTLANYCYSAMFNGCTNLSYVKALFTTTPGISYTADWLAGVSSTGTFVKSSSATWNVTGANGIPTGWTVETASE